MEYRRLGHTDVMVSAISYGLMTFGEQNTEAEAHALLDIADEAGVNFFDVAELYPVPPRAETQGETERMLGSWVKARGNRDKVVIATKVVGARAPAHFRNGTAQLDRKNLTEALDRSLKALDTDYIDVYYTHWPNRRVNNFGRLDYTHVPQDDGPPIEEAWACMDDFIKAGKIRYAAISNETPWGLCEHVKLSETKGLPRPVAIQNVYHLMNRLFEVGTSEPAIREQVGLCAYSVLAMGLLSGKYRDGARPENSRLALFGDRYPRYDNRALEPVTARYVDIATAHGLDPAAMAIAFALSRPFMTSVIIGATTPDQLRANLSAMALNLGPEIVEAINAVHAEFPNPVQ
ncbi:MAG: aldo/keto reductase [Rhodospirillaceae bacterium]